MITFKQHITEQTRGKGLTIFDIDETLFRTKALVRIIKDGKVIILKTIPKPVELITIEVKVK